MESKELPVCPAFDLTCPYLEVHGGYCKLENADQECEYMMEDVSE